MTAYLQPGDQIHLVWPSTGDQERDKKEVEDLRAAYGQLGVNVAIATISGSFTQEGRPVGLPTPLVVAVFRTSYLLPLPTPFGTVVESR